MKPRLLTRTHYQVDEPAYLILLQSCCSPVKSEYKDTIAGRLLTRLKQSGVDFNLPAAKYAVDLARALQLVTSNSVWTAKGHLVNLLCRPAVTADNELSLPERLLFFRLFLEADGAALIFLARAIKDHGALPAAGLPWTTLATEMFVRIYQEYLELTTDTASRTALRHAIRQRERKSFTGKSGPHQVFTHLQLLYRTGLIGKHIDGKNRHYTMLADDERSPAPLDRFLQEVPDCRTLERRLVEPEWSQLLYRVFQSHIRGSAAAECVDKGLLESLILDAYARICSTGINLCPLETLIESLQIGQLVDTGHILTRDDLMQSLRSLQRQKPHALRFHVDRFGKPAYIKMSS